ncbi:sensor histidine kinase [Wenzhouxiangella sediminis]|uniref:histidine kinase n=1 Tax=Wenzhouxiangella sediminis TaxID=1792836 RepID=A0A3E1K6N8_9GAMM|nr:ATP-binding protein [Wenzhouxiangella sediminis]RFF29678.1 hypothetical protein DZC52_11340 [Wenzhouxiangella sediminis]
MRRRLRTQSVLTLQLAGFALVAFPLLVGLIVSSQQIDRVTRQSEQLLERTISATQSARQIGDRVIAFERAARQFRILQDADARSNLSERRRVLTDELAAFARLVERDALRERIDGMKKQSRNLHRLAADLGDGAEWPPRLSGPFEELAADANRLLVATENASERELRRLEAMGESARNVSLLSLVSTVPVAILLALLMASFLNRRIRRLDRGMRALAQPERARIEQVTSPRDLRALSTRLEWVRRRLVRTERERRQLVGQVSHELKTPLSAIREGTSLLADQSFGRLGNQQREVVGIIQSNITRLQEQIENLLRFNRLQARPEPMRRDNVSLDELVSQVIESHRLSIEANRIRIRRGQPSGVGLSVDPDMLSTAVDNLVTNALKFSPPGSTVAVEVERHGDRALIRVADRGPGVPAQDRSRLFEPFYRGSSPSNRTRPGSGLGLAICRDLVRAHRGDVDLVEQAGWSAVFVIELPLGTH